MILDFLFLRETISQTCVGKSKLYNSTKKWNKIAVAVEISFCFVDLFIQH